MKAFSIHLIFLKNFGQKPILKRFECPQTHSHFTEVLENLVIRKNSINESLSPVLCFKKKNIPILFSSFFIFTEYSVELTSQKLDFFKFFTEFYV